ncbi:MAG: LysM peptidoglycan-binding domain-containing protein, partial [Lachnospiraceae bacterium]|nr:LysM peptidoglycan-binding domain-containing protein [Lachnospiraceae bacterium]
VTATPTPSITATPTPAKTPRVTPTPSEKPKVTPEPSEIPQVVETPAAAAPEAYTIRPGDTLTSISQSVYGSSSQVDAICQLNGISKETIIYPGEKILLP